MEQMQQFNGQPSRGSFFDMPSKSAFIMGLLVGVSVMSVVGLLVVLTRPNLTLGGTTNNNANTNTVATTQATTNTNTSVAQPTTVSLAVAQGDHVEGNPNAKVKIFYFTDYECPFCQQFHPSMDKALTDYGDKIEVVVKHFPLSFHPNAKPAATAAECVAELAGEEKFWPFTTEMYQNQDKYNRDYYLTLGEKYGTNRDALATCLDSGKYDSKISNNYNEGIAAGVRGTPSTFVNGQMISGAVPYDSLKTVIDAALKS